MIPRQVLQRNHQILSFDLQGGHVSCMSVCLVCMCATYELDLRVAGMVLVPDLGGHLVGAELLHLLGAGRHQYQDVVLLALVQDEAVRLVQGRGRHLHLR